MKSQLEFFILFDVIFPVRLQVTFEVIGSERVN